MKYCIALLLLFALAPLSNAALAGACGGDHIHTDEQKKEKKSDA